MCGTGYSSISFSIAIYKYVYILEIDVSSAFTVCCVLHISDKQQPKPQSNENEHIEFWLISKSQTQLDIYPNTSYHP